MVLFILFVSIFPFYSDFYAIYPFALHFTPNVNILFFHSTEMYLKETKPNPIKAVFFFEISQSRMK